MTTEDFHRKLTAILSADVVGYSRLMGDDEAATVKTLETYKGVMSSLIRQHRGRVVDSPGDNLLAEFGSVVDAVQCAVSIQKELQARNADLPENRRMEFRIGINLGDVIEEQDRIYGDGVNIAARLESLADPGGICISKTAFDHIESKLPLGYEYLGEQTVKNIAKPVGAYKVLMETRVVDAKTKGKVKAPFWLKKSVLSLGIIVILAIAGILYWNIYSRAPSIEPASIEPEQITVVPEVKEGLKTIAVLLFDNVSSDPEQDYFAYGLSEEILNSLCQIPELGVAGKTSSFSSQVKDKTIQEIDSLLGVDYVLEGSVRKSGNELRITAQLIQVADNRHLWSETYDRELKDIFDIQEDIATAVADELKATLGVGHSQKQLGGTDNEKAYEFYLIANGQYRDRDPDRALISINEALAIDHDFAQAWALKADIHQGLTPMVSNDRIATELNEGLQAAKKAIELEPNLAAGHKSLGIIKSVMGKWIEAELALTKARELVTDSSLRYEMDYSLHYIYVANLERAKNIFEGLLRNDPLNGNFRSLYLQCLGLLGDVQGAEEEYQRGVALFGDEWSNYAREQITLARLGSGNAVSRDDIIYSDQIHDTAKEHLGSQEGGVAELHRIYTDDNNLNVWDLAYISIWAAYFGDIEFAMDAMEKSESIIVFGVAQNLLWYPVMREVRQTPRFKEFLREIGLVDYWNKFGWPDICYKLDNGDFECD
ncbi:MAG: hypothetical protein JW944_00965 [Deltaproteobacteria bacterium]|nr:hypothetical protein [Deltaproteobacteria bacterium]